MPSSPDLRDRHDRPAFTPYSEDPGREGLDGREVWARIRRGFVPILTIATLVFAAVMVATLLSPMEFRSSGRLYLGELDGRLRAPAGGELELAGSAPGDIGGEMEIIKSRSLVTQAIIASGLNALVTRRGERAPRYWQWLSSRRDPALVDGAERELTAVNASLSNRFGEERAYVVKVLNDDEYEVSAGRVLGRGRFGVPLTTDEFELTLQKGKAPAPRAENSYDLVLYPTDEVADAALRALQVTAPKSGSTPVNVVTLEFTDRSRRKAAVFVEQLMKAYLKERQAWKTEDATAAEAFVSSQLASMKESLDGVQAKLASYRRSNRVVVLDNEAKALIEQVARYEEQRVAARLQVAALEDIDRALHQPEPPMGAYLYGEANDTVLEGMATSLARAHEKLSDLRTRFSDAAPDVKEQQSQIHSQLESIRDYVSSRLSRARQHLESLNGVIGQFEGRLRSVPGAEVGLAQLTRESEVYSKTYSYLLERQQQAAIIKASTLSKNRVLDAPKLSTREDSPKLALRIASALGGAVLGVALVAARALFGGAFETEGALRQSLGQRSPVLGTVPVARRRRFWRLGRAVAEALPQVAALGGETQPALVEAFRTLRTNLYRLLGRSADAGRVVVVTSPGEGDGKTTSAEWLARSLAADGRRVLLIDADLRRRARAGEVASGGLRAVLDGEAEWRELLVEVAAPAGELHVLGCGGATEPEALASERMHELLRQAREQFEFVLIDAPSFPAVSDALVLALRADAVLSVIRLHETDRKLALEHVNELSSSGAAHGLVINAAAVRKGARPSRPLLAPKRTEPPEPKRALPPRAAEEPACEPWRRSNPGALS